MPPEDGVEKGRAEPPSMREAFLSDLHPYAYAINAALVYVVYLLGLGAGFLVDFNPPLSDAWAYGALLFGGLLVTLLLQMKFAKRIWDPGTQNRNMTIAAIVVGALFVAYLALLNGFVADYNGRPLVLGWAMQESSVERCRKIDILEEMKCIHEFGASLEGGSRADAFYGRGQVSTVLTFLHVSYAAAAIALIFAITGLLEMLRTPASGRKKKSKP